jgi:hypothetical protein
MPGPDHPQCQICATPVEEVENGLRLDFCSCCQVLRGVLCAQCHFMVARLEIVGFKNVAEYMGATFVPHSED